MTTDQQEIRTHALSFYEDLYCAESCDRTATEHLLCDLPHLSEEDRQILDNPISFAELSLAVQELSSGKSPGLDGLSEEFYCTVWNLTGEDLYAVFLESFNQEKLPLSCRRAVITLIPKKGDLEFLKNCRPVSLTCVGFKILSKTTNRLKKYMTSIIHEDQSFCVPKRAIFDNLFLVRNWIPFLGSGKSFR